jgi:hypothetical protein
MAVLFNHLCPAIATDMITRAVTCEYARFCPLGEIIFFQAADHERFMDKMSSLIRFLRNRWQGIILA